jgi:hypothetical protein
MTKLPFTLFILLALLPIGAAAQRRVIGGAVDKEADEDAKADAEAAKSDEEKAKQAEEQKKKKAAETEKKREAIRKEDEQRQKAREEAEKAADLAEKKKKAEEEKKLQEKIEAEKQRLDTNRASRLVEAKKSRRYMRAVGDTHVAMAMTPGAPAVDQVVEVRFDISRKLAVASAAYGDLQPMPGARLVVDVTPPETGREGAETMRYRMRPLSAPGSYGIHFTPLAEGEHKLRVTGKTKDGKAVDFEVPVFAGVWPPPDLDDEEAKLRANTVTGRSGRRVID